MIRCGPAWRQTRDPVASQPGHPRNPRAEFLSRTTCVSQRINLLTSSPVIKPFGTPWVTQRRSLSGDTASTEHCACPHVRRIWMPSSRGRAIRKLSGAMRCWRCDCVHVCILDADEGCEHVTLRLRSREAFAVIPEISHTKKTGEEGSRPRQSQRASRA